MYKCKIGVLFFIYLQILPWNKVALFPPHLQEKQPHKSFTSDIGPVINHQQFFPPIRSHLCLYFTFKLGWNCLQQRYVWEFSFSLISMEIRCRAELHPKGAVLFIYINKSCSSIYIFFLLVLLIIKVWSFLLVFSIPDTLFLGTFLLLRPDHPALSGGKSSLSFW